METSVATQGGRREGPPGLTPSTLTRLAVPVLIFGFAVSYYLSISDLNFYARIVPTVALGALAATTGLAAARDLRDLRQARRDRAGAGHTTAVPPSGPVAVRASGHTGVLARCGRLVDSHPGRGTLLVLLTGLLLVGVRHIGFYTSAALYLAVAFALLRVRWWPTLPLLVVGISGAIYLIFDVIIQIRWPVVTPLP